MIDTVGHGAEEYLADNHHERHDRNQKSRTLQRDAYILRVRNKISHKPIQYEKR